MNVPADYEDRLRLCRRRREKARRGASGGQYYATHRECRLAYQKANRARSRIADRQYYASRRMVVFSLYGGACVCCGISDHVVLELDHINNDGSGSRNAHEHYRDALLYQPARYQILCANCNRRKMLLRRRSRRLPWGHYRDIQDPRERRSVQDRKYREGRDYRLRERLYNLYGDRCNKCGCPDSEVLELDHVRNDGGGSRRPSSRATRRAAARSRDPHTFQILCRNCNQRKEKERRARACMGAT